MTISSFGMTLLPVSTAQKVLLPEISESHMQDFWVKALTTASKSIAHFTEKGAVISAARLGFACYATSKLVGIFINSSLRCVSSVLPATHEMALDNRQVVLPAGRL